MRDHLFESRSPEFALVANALVFRFFHGRVEVEGVPRDVKLGVWVGLVVCRDGFFEAALADKTPGADLSSAQVEEGRCTVSETISILIWRVIAVEYNLLANLGMLMMVLLVM